MQFSPHKRRITLPMWPGMLFHVRFRDEIFDISDRTTPPASGKLSRQESSTRNSLVDFCSWKGNVPHEGKGGGKSDDKIDHVAHEPMPELGEGRDVGSEDS